MKLGLLTAAFPDTPLTEVADWAGANGFSMLEVACWPRADGPSRRYAGVSHIDCAERSVTTRPRTSSATSPSGASRSPGWATTPTRCRPISSFAERWSPTWERSSRRRRSSACRWSTRSSAMTRTAR